MTHYYWVSVHTADDDGRLEYIAPGSQLAHNILGLHLSMYDWAGGKEAVLLLSRDYPALLFRVERKGDVYPDYEACWFQNGRHYCERGEVVSNKTSKSYSFEPGSVVFGAYDHSQMEPPDDDWSDGSDWYV